MAAIAPEEARSTRFVASTAFRSSSTSSCERPPLASARTGRRAGDAGRQDRSYSRRPGGSGIHDTDAPEQIGGYRTVLGCSAPARRKSLIGVIVVLRVTTVRPFTDKQIELVTTFADQAVIAIENVRLFDEVQARTRELSAVAGAADGNLGGVASHLELAGRAGAGIRGNAGERGADLRG